MHGLVLDINAIMWQVPDELSALLLERDAHEMDAFANILPYHLHELWCKLQIGACRTLQWMVRHRPMMMQHMSHQDGDAMRRPIAQHVLPLEMHLRLRLALRHRVAPC